MKHEKITPQIAAMYLGQKFDIVKASPHWDKDDIHPISKTVGPSTIQLLTSYPELEIVLHLRSLESLTEAEAKEVYELFYKTGFPDNYPKTAVGFFVARFEDNEEYPPTVFLYLLSKGFDLFQMIPNGLAKAIK